MDVGREKVKEGGRDKGVMDGCMMDGWVKGERDGWMDG